VRPWLFEWSAPGLGTVAASSYFTLLLAAFALAAGLAVGESRRSAEDPRIALRVAVVQAVFGLVGGRLGHVIFEAPGRYVEDPARLLRVWEGGMVYYGGFLLAVAAGTVVARRGGVPGLRMADIYSAPLAAGMALGRLGCYAAGCCYGRPIDWPWGIEWPWGVEFLGGQVPKWLLGISLHPTQIYESLSCLALFFALRAVRARQHGDGQALGALLVGYAILRSAIEPFRYDLDRGFVAGTWLSTSQAISIPLFGCGVLLFWRGFRAPGDPRSRKLDRDRALYQALRDRETTETGSGAMGMGPAPPPGRASAVLPAL
jgi:phosphatidylglycerol:prolipoprotein diacylglycerol transferase